MTVINLTDRLLEANNAVGPSTSMDDALKQIGEAMSVFVGRVSGIYANQVTFGCTLTGRALYDVVRARMIREHLRKVFDAFLESFDEEIEDELTQKQPVK